MEITIKGKTDSGKSFNDTHVLTDVQWIIIDTFLSYDRDCFKKAEQDAYNSGYENGCQEAANEIMGKI